MIEPNNNLRAKLKAPGFFRFISKIGKPIMS
jgi:hypothetical protein